MKKALLAGTFLSLAAMLLWVSATAGTRSPESIPAAGELKLLEPITHGDLTIYPVVSTRGRDTSDFITLDEGIRSGEVVVTETGNLHPMMRRRSAPVPQSGGAQVNRLVLVNNSKRPLILLAGEIVTGGKQDRVVGKDRIVAPESDPVDLAVFCVEPHRWVEKSANFDTHGFLMAQPSVRAKAMVDKDQQKVWDEVNNARTNLSAKLAATPTPAMGGPVGSYPRPALSTVEVQAAQAEIANSSSYAGARENVVVQKELKSVTEPMQKSYESLIKQLRNQNAVGVVVAVRGRIVWADIFASHALLNKYWPKLLQSYAAESLTASGQHGEPSMKEALRFLEDWSSRHETVDSEPGLYRQRELVGDHFRAFALTSLLGKDSFDLHLSKMAD
jgi:ARG/rhodanese/phosphatase superfamily protein